MPKINVETIRDKDNVPVPQYLDSKTSAPKQHLGNHAPYQQLLDENGVPYSKSNPLPVALSTIDIDLGTF